MKKRSILVGALAISLLGLFYLEDSLLLTPAMAQSTYRMDIQTWASGGPYLEQVKIFGKRLETMSSGRSRSMSSLAAWWPQVPKNLMPWRRARSNGQ